MPQSLNRYPYVLNNPASLIDPTGLCVLGLPCPKPPKPGDIIDKVGDFVECTSDLPGCAKNAAEDYVVAPILDVAGYHDAASCIRNKGTERCLLEQGGRGLDWGAKGIARKIVGEKGYIDINATIPVWGPLAGVVGVQMDARKGLLLYGGGGVGTLGFNITGAPGQTASEGLVCGAQLTVRGSLQVGASASGTHYYETGAGFPAGFSATCFGVVDVR